MLIWNSILATGKNEELDLDKLLKVGSHQARDPFNLRAITFESYDIINSAGKYVNKKPKYEGLDENMKSLMKEFKIIETYRRHGSILFKQRIRKG